MNESALVKMGALWKKQGKDGATFLSGGEGAIKFLVLPNNNKNKNTSPDYYLYVAQREQKPPAGNDSVGDIY